MKPKVFYKPLLILGVAIFFMGFVSCNHKSGPVPFPSDYTEYSQPQSAPLEFSEPTKIDWQVNDTTNFKLASAVKVNLTNLPSKPFYPDGFSPLKAPIEEMNLGFNKDLDTLIDFEVLNAKPLEFTTSILEAPLVVKAGLPKIKKKATVGIFEFGEDQGFPGYVVDAMLEDTHGMMWIATDKGICRFDGEYLEIYDCIDSNFTGSQATVINMVEDKTGRIWVYTAEKGIYVLDLKARLLSNVSLVEQNFPFIYDLSMIMDDHGFIWLGTAQKGLYIIDPANHTFRHTPHIRPNDNGNTKKLVKDAAGNIWVGSNVGLSKIDLSTGKIQTLEVPNGLSFLSVSGLFRDSKNRIWVGTEEDGIFIINDSRDKIRHIGSAHSLPHSIHQFTEDFDEKLWMSSKEGVYILDYDKQTYKSLNESKGLSDNLIYITHLDHEGQIWIASEKGLDLIDTEGITAQYLTAADGLSGSDAWSFFNDSQGQLWIGTLQGIDIYDPIKKRITKVVAELQLKKFADISYRIQNLQNGQYLIVSPGFGLSIFDPTEQTIKTMTSAHGLTNIFPASTFVDSSGRIWTGGFQNGMIEVIDLQNKTSKVLTNKNGLIGNIVWEFTQDHTGQIWVATDFGLNIINIENNTISHLMEEGRLSERNTGGFYNDQDGRLWIGSRSGLLIADQKKNLLTTLKAESGLVNKAVYTLYEHKGTIYAGTGNGLTVFTPVEDSINSDQFEFDIKSYGKEQGLIYTDFNADAVIAFDENLWWGIEREVITVTNIPKQDKTQNTVYITGITISDQPQNFYNKKDPYRKYPDLDTLYTAEKDTFYLSENFPEEKGWLHENNIQWDSIEGYFNLPVNLKIPFEQNYVSFQFTGNQLTNRDKTRYSYYLEGIDNEWSEISDNPFSENYRNLPAGDYTFKVRSRTFDRIWSEPTHFSFTILPHWSNTWWAWLLYVATFLIVVSSIVQYRSRALKRQNLLLEEKVNDRTAQLNRSVENLKATQSQLIQSEKMASLGELTAGIAHEIQNPLNFVNNFSEINQELAVELKEELKKGEIEEAISIADNIRENEEKIMHHGRRADSIVKGMLQHSRNHRGEKLQTDINELCDEYLRLAYHGMRAKDKSFNASLETDFDQRIEKLMIVPQDIGRVILNIINNSLFAIKDKQTKIGDPTYNPTIWVSTKKEKDKIAISIKDNGMGIPDPVKDKIYQPFFTTKPPGQGTGLGLSMSYDIIKAHGGELKVETIEGENTNFTILLPY